MTDDRLLSRCGQIATSTWSDALDEFDIESVVAGIAQRSGRGRFAAYAVTAREVAGPLRTFARGEFAVGSLITSVGPGQALVVDAGGAQISTFGGLATLAASLRGVAAVVIDGGCRDIEEIRATDLWLASRFVTPTSGKTRIRVESIGDPVHLGGVLVRTGDLVVGDETGIVIVPRAEIAAVLARAEAIVEKDRMIEAALRAGQSFSEAATAADYI
jgi:regulator of RNase E activity RraA